MRLALVLEHLQSQRWLIRVAKVLLQVITIQMIDASFKADRALFQYSELLVTHGHVVQGQQKYELITFNLFCLDLIQHRLGFLKKDQSLFVLFLGNEVQSTFIQLVDDHWNLIFFQVEVFVVIFFKRVF